MEYRCGDTSCKAQFTSFKSAIDHRVSGHPKENITIYKRTINQNTELKWNIISTPIIPANGTVIYDEKNDKIKFKRNKAEEEVEVKRNKPDTDNQHDDSDDENEMSDKERDLQKTLTDLIPGVCRYLCREDSVHSESVVQFLRLLSQGTFPLRNICWLVFCDLIQKLSVPLKAMRYSAAVKQFWYVMKLFFKQRCINWMRGLPDRPNFIIPYNLDNPDGTIPDRIEMGFVHEMADIIATNCKGKKFNVSMDLKAINASKADPNGCYSLDRVAHWSWCGRFYPKNN